MSSWFSSLYHYIKCCRIFLAQTEARLVRGSSTGHVASSLAKLSDVDLVGVTWDVLCEPERFGGQIFLCRPGRSGKCFHVYT